MIHNFQNPRDLRHRLITKLDSNKTQYQLNTRVPIDTAAASAVLLLLGMEKGRPGIILNKRSQAVRQPGDLCCPGGGIHPRMDPLIGKFLRLPFMPLGKWPPWKNWRGTPKAAGRLSLLLATALREGFEEMRLNPLGTSFLGPLPPQHLVLFRRIIYPLAAWVNRQTRFFPNWEVEKLVRIPLLDLQNPSHYRRLDLQFEGLPAAQPLGKDKPLVCFVHETDDGMEYLWGATFRIVMTFLEIGLGFTPPPADRLPEFKIVLDSRYLTAG